jgi:hypothetical protein
MILDIDTTRHRHDQAPARPVVFRRGWPFTLASRLSLDDLCDAGQASLTLCLMATRIAGSGSCLPGRRSAC